MLSYPNRALELHSRGFVAIGSPAETLVAERASGCRSQVAVGLDGATAELEGIDQIGRGDVFQLGTPVAEVLIELRGCKRFSQVSDPRHIPRPHGPVERRTFEGPVQVRHRRYVPRWQSSSGEGFGVVEHAPQCGGLPHVEILEVLFECGTPFEHLCEIRPTRSHPVRERLVERGQTHEDLRKAGDSGDTPVANHRAVRPGGLRGGASGGIVCHGRFQRRIPVRGKARVRLSIREEEGRAPHDQQAGAGVWHHGH